MSSRIASIRPRSMSTRPRGSRTDTSSGWGRRSATRPRSCMRAARSGCASSPRPSTWSTAAGRSGSSDVARIGVLGGAFNPPHVGHLLLGQEARWQLGLDRVLLMVTGKAPHKAIEDDPGAGVRLEMARLAAGGEEGVEASGLEVERHEVSYSYRTLELLSDREPEAELYFLLGADMATGLAEWREPARVVELARLGVVPRPGV